MTTMKNKKTLVIGASTNPERYAYKAIMKLIDNGYDVVAIGKKAETLSIVTIEKDLVDFEDIDTVTLYVNPSIQKNYYQYIIDLKPQRVIFNPGTENEEFYKLLEQNNIQVEVACTLVLLSINQY
jgi:predicted CoA-binding protein